MTDNFKHPRSFREEFEMTGSVTDLIFLHFGVLPGVEEKVPLAIAKLSEFPMKNVSKIIQNHKGDNSKTLNTQK